MLRVFGRFERLVWGFKTVDFAVVAGVAPDFDRRLYFASIHRFVHNLAHDLVHDLDHDLIHGGCDCGVSLAYAQA